MKEADALKILNQIAQADRKIDAFQTVADKLGVPLGTVYHWWYTDYIPPGRLRVFDLLKKSR